jgi:HK97 family phage prohead protease
MAERGYETARRNSVGLERGGVTPIMRVDGRAIVPSIKAVTADDGKVLQGYCCLFNRAALTTAGTVKLIKPGAFDHVLVERRRVEFWLDHDKALTVGSTDEELELLAEEKGIAFRFRFPSSPLGQRARHLASSLEYTGMSVGFLATEYKSEKIEGFDVSIITKADLEEISFVKRGAIEPAFGLLVDPQNTLAEALRTSMPSDSAYTALMRAIQKLEEI